MMIASATLPDHILDDIQHKLSITKDAQLVVLSNDCPNIALSVQVMKHSEDSKADLWFLIPNGTSGPNDIPITLVYVNEHNTTEDITDKLCQWGEDVGLKDHLPLLFFTMQRLELHKNERLKKSSGKETFVLWYALMQLGW